MENIIDTRSEEYKAGANDLWKYAKVLNDNTDLCERLFNGTWAWGEILNNYTGAEVLKRARAYFETIEIGDVIYSDITKTGAIISHIDGFGQWYCINNEGISFKLDEDDQQYWKKIGHNENFIDALKDVDMNE